MGEEEGDDGSLVAFQKGEIRSFWFMMSAGNWDGIVGDLWWRRWGWVVEGWRERLGWWMWTWTKEVWGWEGCFMRRWRVFRL